MKVATWNINSVRVRMDRLLGWLARQAPDVLCLQETKCADEEFPLLELQALGYHAALFGQRTYNGVAILARDVPQDVVRGFGDGAEDPQARFIAATVAGVRIACAYMPNGQAVGSEKFAYKLDWMKRLRMWLASKADPRMPLALCGDFNVAPEARDVCNPAFWEREPLFHPQARAALENVAAWGLSDAFRLHHADAGMYSWWDYRMLAFPKDQGLRIDHIFCTPSLAACCRSVEIDRDERKGKLPSDHAPVVAVFEL